MLTPTRAVIVAIGLACASCFAAGEAISQTLAALPSTSPSAPAAGEARPIAGWTDFCRRLPAECAFDPAEPAAIALTGAAWTAIVSVNRRVNARISAITDADHWGVPDRWDLPTDEAGDCEDFQLLKRKLLAGSGLPRRAMRMTVVIDEKNEGHAVLMIRTDRGDFILDNKTDAVLHWFDTGYVFVKRESQERIGWTSLGGAVSPTATANR